MCTETWPWPEPLNSHYDLGKDRHGDSHKHWPQGHLERGWTIMTETKVTQETWSLKERSLTACMIIETTLEQQRQTCRLLMLYKIQWPCTLPYPESQTGPPPITSTMHPWQTAHSADHQNPLWRLLLPPKNHQGLELVTHESNGGPHPWCFWVKGIKLKNYL